MESRKDSCERIFNELVNIGLISRSHSIKVSDKWDYFHAGLKTIHYNLKMNQLSENSIRISLLHEEGHIRFLYRSILYLFLIFIVIMSIVIFIQFEILVKIFSIIIIVLISVWYFLFLEEYQCDKFASILLRDKYKISKPSLVLEKTLEKMPHYGLSALTHPSINQRVKKIAEIVDEKTFDIKIE